MKITRRQLLGTGLASSTLILQGCAAQITNAAPTRSESPAISNATSTTAKKFQIGMVVFEGMTNLDLAGPLEIFPRLPDTQVHLIGRENKVIHTDTGMPFLPTISMDDAPKLDLLFIGGGDGTNTLLEDEKTLLFFANRAPDAKWITSVCTGAIVLGAAGLLNGYKAATHWTAMDILPYFGAEPVHQRVVVDRNRITGGGVTAGIDFGLTLAAILHGPILAQSMQLGMEYDPQPPFNTGSPKKASQELINMALDYQADAIQMRLAIAKRIAQRRG